MFNFTVRPDDAKEFTVTATARDVVQWERINKSNSVTQLQQNMRMSDLYRIAHLAASRKHLYNGTFAEFEESCDIEILDEDDDSDPTQSAA